MSELRIALWILRKNQKDTKKWVIYLTVVWQINFSISSLNSFIKKINQYEIKMAGQLKII